MSNILLHAVVCLTVTLAYKQNIPIGIVVDTAEDDVAEMLKILIDVYNNNNEVGNKIIINASWDIASLDNNCELIRSICRCLDSGVFLLLGSSSSRSYNIIQSYSQALHVPYVVYTRTTNHSRDEYNYDISVSPNYINPVIDVIKFFQWSKIYYVFDTDDALWELQCLHDAFRPPEQELVVDARRIRNATSSHDFLRHLDRFSTRSGIKRIVLNLSSKEIYQTVLNQLVDVGMNRHNYHYLLSGPYIDALDLRSFLYGGVNVTGFRLPIDLAEVTTPHPNYQAHMLEPLTALGISTDAALAGDALRLVQQALNSMMESPSTRHIFKTFRHSELYNNASRGVQCWRHPPVPWIHGPLIKDALLKAMISGMTGPIIFDDHGVRVGYKLDIMHLEYRTPLRKVGTWTLSGRIHTNMSQPHNESVVLDANRTRIVTTILENPFVMRKCPEDGTPCHGSVQFEGYCIDLLHLVASKVNFDYVVKLVDDNAYGTRLPDGTWNGLIGELLTGKADIAVAALTITEIRERFVDFSKPFMQLGTSIMIKKPDKEKAGVFSFKNPLSDDVWLAIICGFFGVSLVLYFVGHFSSSEKGKGSTARSKPAFSLANTLWFSFGALMQQGSDIYPRSVAGRIVGTAWWFFTLIIISSYTANLAAFLTIERMEVPINSADDLARQTEIHYGIIANGSTEEFFKVSNVTVYNKMWNFMRDAQPSVFVQTTEQGVNRVRSSKGKYAFLLDSSFNEYHNQRTPCNTIKVGRNLDVKGYGIATPRNSDLRSSINIAVLELNEVGELLQLYLKWWYEKGQCAADTAKQESNTSALTLSNVSGIFHILIGGLILAMVTAFIDFLLKRKLRQIRRTKASMKVSRRQHDQAETFSYENCRQESEENEDKRLNQNGPGGVTEKGRRNTKSGRFSTAETSLSRELQGHRCRHTDEVL